LLSKCYFESFRIADICRYYTNIVSTKILPQRGIFSLCVITNSSFAKTWLNDFNLGFTTKKTKNNSQERFFRENATFYHVLSTKNLSLLSPTNYRLQSTNYCKETLNHHAEHEKKKLFFVVESFLKFVCCFDFQNKNGKKTRFCRFRRKYTLRKSNFIGY